MDKLQKRIWAENREKLLGTMGDYRPWTVMELAKKSGLTRASVYDHLHMLTSGAIIIREGSKWRLHPEWVSDDCQPRWRITCYNKVILPNGTSAEFEVGTSKDWLSKLPGDVQNRLQIQGNRVLAQKLLRANEL